MKEYNLAVKIREILNNDKNQGVAEVPIKVFIDVWFRGGNNLTDLTFTKKLMGFAELYGFGYVSILGPGNRAQAIRFWEKEKQELLGEENEAIEEEEQK